MSPVQASKQNLEKAVSWYCGKSEVMQYFMQGNIKIRTGYCLSFRKTSIPVIRFVVKPGWGRENYVLLTYNMDPLCSSKWHWNRNVNDYGLCNINASGL